MEYFIIFDISIFILLAIILLIFGLSIISNIELFVSQHITDVMVVAIIFIAIMSIILLVLTNIINKKFKFRSILNCFLSLLAGSQFVFYLYNGLQGLAGHTTLSRIFLFILFLVYGIINIGVYLYADFWIFMGCCGPDNDKSDRVPGFLAPILVCGVGWIVNAIIFA